jgi:hypothetical protein
LGPWWSPKTDKEKQMTQQLAIQTAFLRGGAPNLMVVEVVEYDQDAETGEPVAAIITAGGTRAVVKRSSLRWVEKVQAAAGTSPVTEPGMYKADDGSIYKVQESKTSGNLYAKVLRVIGGERLVETGDKMHADFEYAPGAVRSLRADQRMTLDEAKAFGIQYGFCIVCGAFLKDATSVAAGIGPVCAGRI